MISNSTIATVAYKLWEDAGKPKGRDTEFWLAAENQIKQPKAASIKTAAKRSRITKTTRMG